jgi:hypothetical protein
MAHGLCAGLIHRGSALLTPGMHLGATETELGDSGGGRDGVLSAMGAMEWGESIAANPAIDVKTSAAAVLRTTFQALPILIIGGQTLLEIVDAAIVALGLALSVCRIPHCKPPVRHRANKSVVRSGTCRPPQANRQAMEGMGRSSSPKTP